METMNLSKEYTFEEVRDEIGQQTEDALLLLSDALEASSNLSSCFGLRIVNLLNVKDNIHALRRDLFAVDQALEQISNTVDVVYQHISAQSPPPPAPSEEAGDEQAG